jgi:flagellar FliJ protein
MVAFRFKLEKVLDYRRQVEDQAKQALAAARRRQELEEERLTGLEAELLLQRSKLQERIAEARERWLTGEFIKGLQEDIKKIRADLLLLKEEVSRRQFDLELKARDRKLLEKLRDKQSLRHTREENLREQRENDETAILGRREKALTLL